MTMAQPAWVSAAALQGTLAASAQNVAACTCSSNCEKRLALATAVAKQHIALGLAPQHTRALRILPSHGGQLQEPYAAVGKQTQQMAQLLEQQSLQIQAQQDALQKLLQKRNSTVNSSATDAKHPAQAVSASAVNASAAAAVATADFQAVNTQPSTSMQPAATAAPHVQQFAGKDTAAVATPAERVVDTLQPSQDDQGIDEEASWPQVWPHTSPDAQVGTSHSQQLGALPGSHTQAPDAQHRGLQRAGASETGRQQRKMPFPAACKSSLVKQHAFGGKPSWVDRDNTSMQGPEHDAPSEQPEQDSSQAEAAAAAPDFEDPHKAKAWQKLTHLQQRMLDAEEAAGMLAMTGQEHEQGSPVTALITAAPGDTQLLAAASEFKPAAASSCGLSDSDVHRILAHRRAYIKQQRAFDRACVGNEHAAFDPTQVVESIADMLLDDVLQQSAAELGAACDSLAEDMFESEFVVGSGKSRSFQLAGGLSP
ncbi:hypothetical protein WJX82_005522 [Trebouxia sp. C0006]